MSVEKRRLMIIGVIIVVVAIAAVAMLGSSNSSQTNMKILNNGEIGENGTIYVKLTDNENNSLANKDVRIDITDKAGKTVFSKTVKTSVTGVGIAQVGNITEGKYTVNATFDGDKNLTKSSASKQISIKSGFVKDDVNITVSDDSTASTPASASQTVSQSSDSSDSPAQTPDEPQQAENDQSDGENENAYIDENGNDVPPVIDENGREISQT